MFLNFISRFLYQPSKSNGLKCEILAKFASISRPLCVRINKTFLKRYRILPENALENPRISLCVARTSAVSRCHRRTLSGRGQAGRGAGAGRRTRAATTNRRPAGRRFSPTWRPPPSPTKPPSCFRRSRSSTRASRSRWSSPGRKVRGRHHRWRTFVDRDSIYTGEHRFVKLGIVGIILYYFIF